MTDTHRTDTDRTGTGPAETPRAVAREDLAALLAEINERNRDGFAGTIGLTLTEGDGDRLVGQWTAGPAQHQPNGIVHGGVHCAVIESMASVAGSIWLAGRGHVVGVNNNTNFVRAAREGVLTATATPVQRGRTQQLWQVEIVDEDARLIAHGQVRLANIEDTARLGR